MRGSRLSEEFSLGSGCLASLFLSPEGARESKRRRVRERLSVIILEEARIRT